LVHQPIGLRGHTTTTQEHRHACCVYPKTCVSKTINCTRSIQFSNLGYVIFGNSILCPGI
jgi:hypothetical protein